MASGSTSKAKKPVAEQVSAYLAKQPPNVRKELGKLRAAIKSAAPRAEEWFSYGIPGFRFEDRPLMWYAGWKTHTSVYPITKGMREANTAELDGYETSKGTVRFPLSKPVPTTFVKRLVKARVAEIRAGGR